MRSGPSAAAEPRGALVEESRRRSPAHDTGGVGFNPYRKFVPKRADYVFVIAAIVAVIALVAWTAFG